LSREERNMKACVKTGKSKLEVLDVEMPKKYDENDVLIKVSRVGICGSDIHLWKLEDRIGLIMGHEFCGIVEDPGTSKFEKGERVVVIPKGPRGYESTPGVKAPGAYAEYFYAAEKFVRKLPEAIDDNTATLIEPCGIAYKALRKADISLGDKVLVTGTGIIGLLSAAWARSMGATYIAMTEVNDKRIKAAERISEADEIFDAKDPNINDKLKEATAGGFDKVIECTAAEPAVNLGLDLLKYGGKLILVGVSYKKIPMDTLKILMKEIKIEGTFGSSVVFDKVIELLSLNLFDTQKYITKEIGLGEIQNSFEELDKGNSEQIKIIITP
jgi:L-iditol 2-dehydrogenase